MAAGPRGIALQPACHAANNVPHRITHRILRSVKSSASIFEIARLRGLIASRTAHRAWHE
jgi:hypothetical protein